MEATPSAQGSVSTMFRVLWENRTGFAYLLLVMTVMSCLSHGTQDLYPDFLKSSHGFSRSTVSQDRNPVQHLRDCRVDIFWTAFRVVRQAAHDILALAALSALALYPWAFGAAPSRS